MLVGAPRFLELLLSILLRSVFEGGGSDSLKKRVKNRVVGERR